MVNVFEFESYLCLKALVGEMAERAVSFEEL